MARYKLDKNNYIIHEFNGKDENFEITLELSYILHNFTKNDNFDKCVYNNNYLTLN